VLTAAAGAVAVASGATYLLQSRQDDGKQMRQSEPGDVLTPVAYQFSTNPPPAAGQLRNLAARITSAPYDTRPGRYAHHRIRIWGVAAEADGQGRVDFPLEKEAWVAADRSGATREAYLPPEFPDEQSRRHWQRLLIAPSAPPPVELMSWPPNSIGPAEELPSDRRRLADRMQVGRDIAIVVKSTGLLFQDYLVPRETRAVILQILADVPGLVWRGEVTDRAGRAGLAVSGDGANEQAVLIFDPQTGVLLAQEYVQQSNRPRGYALLLNADRVDHVG
jgi:hypothetical protein